MKSISLKKAYRILEDAVAVIVNEHALVYPSLWELNGEKNNPFLYLSWDDNGNEYTLTFSEDDNKKVEVEGCNLYLYDKNANCRDDEDVTILTILGPKQID